MLSSHSERRCSKNSEKNTCGRRTGWKSGPFRIGMRSHVKAGAPRGVPNSVIKSRCKFFGCRPPCPALAAPSMPCAPCEAALCASSCTVTLDIDPSAQWRRKFDQQRELWYILLSEAPPHSTTQLLHMRLACRRACSTCVGCFKCPLDRTLDVTSDCVSTREEHHKQNQQHAQQMPKQRCQHTVGISRKNTCVKKVSCIRDRHCTRGFQNHGCFMCVFTKAWASVCAWCLRGTGICDVDVCSCVCGVSVGAWVFVCVRA